MKRVLTIYMTILMLLMCGCSSSEPTKEHTGEVRENSPTPTMLQGGSLTPTKGEEDKVEIRTEYEIYLMLSEGTDGHHRIDYNTADISTHKEEALGSSYGGNKPEIRWTIEGEEKEFEYFGTYEISGNRYTVDHYENRETMVALLFFEDTTDLCAILFLDEVYYAIEEPIDSEEVLIEFGKKMMEKFQGSIDGHECIITTKVRGGEKYNGFYIPKDCEPCDVEYQLEYEFYIDGIPTSNSPYLEVLGDGSLTILSLGQSDVFYKYKGITLDHPQLDALVKDTVEIMCNTDKYDLNTYTSSNTLRVVDGELFVDIFVKPTLEEKNSGDKIEPEGFKFRIPLE